MKTLSQIELFLVKALPSNEEKIFLTKSRCVCNYLERKLSRLNFKTECSRINIKCVSSEEDVGTRQLKHEPYLEVCLMYSMPEIAKLDNQSLQQHYIQILKLGLKAAQDYMPVPYQFCIETLNEFQESGYLNEWVQADKAWKRQSLRSVITAHLTTESFFLTQKVEIGNEVVATKKIAEEMPRERLFNRYLGDLFRDRSGDIVYKKSSQIISRFKVDCRRFADDM